jgi:uncharacterized protein
VGCRGKGGKRTLVRVVRAPDGSVTVDITGKAPGRGAYLHRDPGCVAAGIRRGGLARALRTSLSQAELGNLRKQIESDEGAAT